MKNGKSMDDYDLFNSGSKFFEEREEYSSSYYIEKIRSISPTYTSSSNTRVDGHFTVKVGTSDDSSNTLKLPFKVILNHKIQNDTGLFDFLTKGYSDKNLSKAVADLYDIGFPVDDWVKEYIVHTLDNTPRYVALLSLINFLKKFREEDSDEK